MTALMRLGVFVAASLFAAPAAGAAVCEASYQADGKKATRWFSLGKVVGAQMAKNCVAKAKNDLGGRKSSELGLGKLTCDDLPVVVKLFTRIEVKAKPVEPDAELKPSFGLACPPARK